MTKKSIAVFASGSGSNFQAIAEAIEQGELQATIRLVVTDKQDAYVVERAKTKGISVLAIRPKDFSSKQAYEAAILEELEEKEVEWLELPE